MKRSSSSSSQPSTKPAPSGRKVPAPQFEPVFWIPPIVTRQPDGSVTVRAGKPVLLGGEDEISTAEAGRILGCTGDWCAELCDRGVFVEAKDWRRLGKRGNYRLKRASVIAYGGLQPKESAA